MTPIQIFISQSALGAWILAVALAAPVGWISARLARRFAGATFAPALPLIIACMAVAASGAAFTPHGDLIVTLALGWTLALLGCIDVLALRLPDALTLPLLVAGLLLGPLVLATPFAAHVIGAAAGYGVIALLGCAFARLRGREGIGLGDAKLLACAGAWLGWRALPDLMLIAAAGGLAWVAAATLGRGKAALTAPIPFGAPLSGAFWILWLLAIHGDPGY